MNHQRFLMILLVLVCVFVFPFIAIANDDEKDESKSKFDVPNHVLDVSKENTFPNTTEDQEVVEPSDEIKELIDEADSPIKNPDLIKVLNQTTINPTPLAFGYRGMVYIGRWPLSYKSNDTNINWEYQKINTNETNNINGDSEQKMHYNQQDKKEVKGALTNKITDPDDIKKMMLLQAKEKIELPLSYTSIIGQNTKKDNAYRVPAEKYGQLEAYAPAVNETGQVTFGDVYFQLKGNNKSIVIKNVTKQGIGSWIPIQDHISFSFKLQ